MSMIVISKEADDVVHIHSNDGGYLGGKCFACNQSGYLNHRHGTPHRVKNTPGNHLRHTAECPMNMALNDDGGLM